MYTVKTGTQVSVYSEGEGFELKKLTKDFAVTEENLIGFDAAGRMANVRFPKNSRGIVGMQVLTSDLHDSNDFHAEANSQIPSTCQRHGGPLDKDGCWECRMEADERRAEEAEDRAVAEYKHHRDAPALENLVNHAAADIADGTYTVAQPDGSYVTVRLETSTHETNRDGQPNGLKGKRIASFLSGPDNELDFTGFAFWDAAKRQVALWKRFRDSSAIQKYVGAFNVIARSDDQGQYGEAYALRSGRCCKCHHKLTVPASLHRGMGPVCAAGGRDQ